MKFDHYTTTMKSGHHWSLIVRKGAQLTFIDKSGHANLGILFYNPSLLSEKLNIPDTLKCQHTFKLTQGHCLYSDMGRIFGSITKDTFGWHDAVCGNSHEKHIQAKWGDRSYQTQRNVWLQNGHDAFLVELGKYKLTAKDMAANINLFSKTFVDNKGNITLDEYSNKNDLVQIRFELDTLVVHHSCPHPLDKSITYPDFEIEISLSKAPPISDDDECYNHCNENKRGFKNNALYHFCLEN